MYYRNIYVMTTAALGLALAFGMGIAVGQSAPTENKGVKISPPTTLELRGEIDSVEARQLRLRVVTVEPGGVVGIHSHNGRPAVAYVVQGTLTEYVEGGGVHERKQGESWTEGKATTHWAENKGSSAAVVVAVDVFKP
ncbi:MAG TPA: cupin domain-containing protein [Burkholderiales bacterium]|jgi:quercetin dioxygenase-like cupin family protein|nr:cupin domain-containing protein [Burkholderiales bacterium]